MGWINNISSCVFNNIYIRVMPFSYKFKPKNIVYIYKMLPKTQRRDYEIYLLSEKLH